VKRWLKPSLDWFLIFVPLAVLAEHLSPDRHTLIFAFACLAILPLAGWLGRATEMLATRTGEGVGGLLNATFGNAAELVIALAAMRKGLYDVVKASLTGSIIGNLLLVAGLAMFCGGLRYPHQRFNMRGARAQATLLSLAAVSMLVPAGFHHLAGPAGRASERSLAMELSVVLLLLYGASLWFSLRTHRQLFSGEESEPHHGKPWSLGASLSALTVATALIAWMSEILVGSVEQAAHSLGMSSIFVGVIVVAVIGNAAEHSTAVLVALKDKMDLAMGIAIGSSIQIALFVAPVLVLTSYLVAPQPMDYLFTTAEVMAVVLSILVIAQVSGDGETNWLEGLLMLGVYVILGMAFYFLPEPAAGGR